MNEQLKTLLEKLPVVPLILVAGAYLGWDYYTFTTDPSSPLLTKQQQVVTVQQDTATTKAKVIKAEEFFRTLEARRSELRQLAIQLEEAKASISEQMDVSSFVKMVVAEANKVGMTVLGIRPTESHDEEYYTQQSFDLKFHGVFVQLVVFMERLANLERIIRVGEIHLKPISAQNNQYVELDGRLQLNTYRYRGSKADELTKAASAQSSAPVQQQPPKAQQPSTPVQPTAQTPARKGATQ